MKLPAFELERFLSRREFMAPYNLCASDCESLGVRQVLEMEPGSSSRFGELSLGYTEPAGAPSLRAEIAGLYESLSSDDVIVHAAGEEAIFTFMNAALSPGDHVIVHHPSYQSLSEIPRAIGCDVTLWQAKKENGWRLDIDFLKDSLRSNTRAVVVNLPHSPTGYLMGAEEWRCVVDIVRDAGVLLFGDEAYRGLEYSVSDRLPAVCDVYEKGCCLGLLSKGYGLPGLRIGWLATRDRQLREGISRIKDYTTICTSAPSEFLAEIAIRNSERILDGSRRIIGRNLAAFEEFLGRHLDEFEWVPPRAGPVAFPTYLGSGDVEGFCPRVLSEAGVLLLPGTVFTSPSREFRVGFGRRNMREGLRRLDDYLKT